MSGDASKYDLLRHLRLSADISVPTLADLHALQTFRRKWGVSVYVYDDGVNTGTYKLVKGENSDNPQDNLNWVKDTGGGGYEPKNSIEVDADELQLVGDEASPGNSKYYGTDGAGAKGFHDLPAGGGHTIKDTDGTALTQRDTLKFKGYLTATDNAVSEESEADIPEEVFSDVEFLDPYNVPAAAQVLLEDTGNWTSGAYTGTAPAGCKAGMKHYDSTYVFEFFTDTLPIRTARS